MRLAFAITLGCAGATACCLRAVDSGLVETGSDGGGVEAPLVWPPGTAAIATGDLNQDGIEDLALLQFGADAGRIYLYHGMPDGGLSQGPIVTLPSSDWFEWDQLVVFDLNGDGWPDLIASGEYEIGIAMNQRDGGFVVYSHSQLNHPIRWVQAGDFDGSGRADLVVGGYEGLARFPDEGDVPSFSAPSIFPVPPLTNLRQGNNVVLGLGVGDLDGDGQEDIVSYEVDGSGDEYLIVRRGLGDGGFLAPEVYPSAPDTPSGDSLFGPIVVADVNGDGLSDVVAATYVGVALRLGLGAGRLGPEVDITGTPAAEFGTTSLLVLNSSSSALPEIVIGGSWNYACGSPGRLPMIFVNDGGGNSVVGVPFSSGQANAGPVAAWTATSVGRPVLVVGDSCAPDVSFIPE
jgi:hypothetical protein